MNETNKKANEIKVSREFAEKIKRQWGELAGRQKANGNRSRSGRRIAEISFVKEHHGKISVRIGLRNGHFIKDNAQEKAFEAFKEKDDKAYIRSRIADFLNKIRQYGYAAVEGEIPEELKEAVLSAMSKNNISTSYKGAKAEAAAKQAAQNIMSERNAEAEHAARRRDAFLIADAKAGEYPYTIKTTSEIEKALTRGVAFILPPLYSNIRPQIIPLVETVTAKTLDTAARMTEHMPVSVIKNNRIASESVTAFTKDGRKVTGAAIELASKNVAQQAYLRLLDVSREKYTDNDKKLEAFLLNTLKHKGIIAKDAAEIPADRIDAAKEYVSQNVAELPSKKASAFFPEDLRLQYRTAKAKEKEIRAKQEPAYQTEKHKIKEALAAAPTLLSEIVSGKKKSSDYSFNDVMQDLRNHPKSDDRVMMSRLLYISLQNDSKLTKDSKIPAECMQKNMALLKEYKDMTANEPQLNFQKFLERKGLIFQKKKAEKQRNAPLTKENRSSVAEAERVSDKLLKMRQKISSAKGTANKTNAVPAKTTEGKKKLTPLQIALIKKRGNDFAR